MTRRISSLFAIALGLGLAASAAGAQGLPRQGTAVPANDSLVECTPANAPAKKLAVATRPHVVRRRPRPAVAAVKKPVVKAVPKVAPKTVAKAVRPRRRRPVVRAVRRAAPVAPPPRARTLVVCRPVHPVQQLANTPVESSVIPVPTLAPLPAAPAQVAELPPAPVPPTPFPTVSGTGGRSWLPLLLVPAFFIPFVHTGGTHSGSTDTTTTTPPPVTPPPVTPPPVVPPTTTPEPDLFILVGTGLMGVGAVGWRRKTKR